MLVGPKFPYWGCSRCGCSSNYASRVRCKCGASAPTKIVQTAKRNASTLRTQPSTVQRSGPTGAWSQGPPKHKQESELVRLRAELAELRTVAKQSDVVTVEGLDSETDDTNIAELVSAVEKLEKTFSSRSEYGTRFLSALQLETKCLNRITAVMLSDI